MQVVQWLSLPLRPFTPYVSLESRMLRSVHPASLILTCSFSGTEESTDPSSYPHEPFVFGPSLGFCMLGLWHPEA